MDQLLKNAQNIASQGVNSVENLVGGAAQAVESAFQPKPISPVPQAQTMPQAQPSGIQGLLSSLPQETMSALSTVHQMFNQGEQTVGKTVGDIVRGAQQFEQGVQRGEQLAPSPNTMLYNTLVKPTVQGALGFGQLLGTAAQTGANAALEPMTGKPMTIDLMPHDVLQQYSSSGPLGVAQPLITAGEQTLGGMMAAATPFMLGANPAGFVKTMVGYNAGLQGTGEVIKDIRTNQNPLKTVSDIIQGTTGNGTVSGPIGGITGQEVKGQFQENPLASAADTLLGLGLPIVHGLIEPKVRDQFNQATASQAAEDIQNGDNDLLNHEAIAPYKRALSIAGDQKTQGDLVNAISDIKTNGMIGDEDANNTINSVSQNLLPKGLTDRLNSIQLAETWEYLLARVNGRVPETVPSWMQNFDHAIFDISGRKALQAGKINFGAKVGEPELTAPEGGNTQPTGEEMTLEQAQNRLDQINRKATGFKTPDGEVQGQVLTRDEIQERKALQDRVNNEGLTPDDQARVERLRQELEKGNSKPEYIENALNQKRNTLRLNNQLAGQVWDENAEGPTRPDLVAVQDNRTDKTHEGIYKIKDVIGYKDIKGDDGQIYRRPSVTLEQVDAPTLKQQLQQTPEQPKMSTKAIKEGVETPRTGRDISVSPQASKRFKKTGTALDALLGNSNQKAEGLNPDDYYLPESTPFDGARESLPPRDEANVGVKGNGRGKPVEIDEGSNNIFNKMLNPLKNLPKKVQEATEAWKAGQDKALVNANSVNLRLKELVDKLGITPSQEWALVNYSQNPTPEFLDRLQKAGYDINQDLIDKAKPLLDLHRQLENERYNRANASGIPTAYRENHIYQQYQEGADEIQQRIEGRGLNKKPGFTFQKKIPTFLDAKEQLDLQPKYSTFGQLNALAEHELGKSIANKDYASFLKDNNRIVPSSQAPRGWKPIMSDNFPRDPETQETYYANPKDAEVINNIFGGQQKTPIQQLLQFTGNLSEKLQSLKLTTPGLSIHGFSIANIVRDQAMALGDAVTGHPVRALRTSGSGIMSALRAFVPGAAESFERDHAYSIKQMADNGLGYSGKQDYRNMQGNVGAKVSTKLLDTGKKVEQAVVTDPTFRKFMFQRKVSLFENFRDSLQSQGYSPEDAAKTAAEQLKSYDGVVNDLGRSPDVKNFLRTFFFAPKYRESIVGAQVNAVKGLFDLNNKDFDFSRRLALGMGMTFLAYNALNMKLNGKPMWQNPAGHEFDLAIPDPNDKTKNYYIPFMPGTTAVPRAVAGTGIALAQGDTDTAEKSFSSLLSSPIQTGIEAFGTKQDYFGRPLFDNTKPLLPQQLGYVASNTFLPSSLNEVGNAIGQAQQGKLNLPIEAARVLQLPIKEGTIPNPFFAARDSQLKTLPLQMQQAYGALQAVSNLDPNDPRRKQVESTLYQAYPQLFDVNKKANIAAAGGDMSKVDPLYTADPAVSKAYLEYQQLNSTAPGSAEEKQYLKNHPEVLQLIQDRSNYFAANPIPQKPGATPYVGAPQASNAVQQLLAAKNYTDPQVQQYLTQHLDYVNQQRAKLGLDPLDQYGNIQGSKNYGVSGISTSQTAGLRRDLRREFSYENKVESAKVSSMLAKADNPIASKKPKMSAMFGHITRPIGNRKTISTMPKHGKSYKTHSVASLMGSSSTPKFHKLPLPAKGKAKRIFI